MGCTSSVPKMVNPSMAEKSIQFEEDISDNSSQDVEEIIYRAANDANVLPSCDTLPEPVHLVRNKSNHSLNHEKENPHNEYCIESKFKSEIRDILHHEERVSRLEEIVDKVVQLHITKIEAIDDAQPVKKNTEEHSVTKETTENHNLEENNHTENTSHEHIKEENKEELENAEDEPPSPTHSEGSSRATRWEALADIAAELPPSLTVDPVTGQIYSVHK